MRKPLIAGNWKLYNTTSEALALVSGIIPRIKGVSGVDVVVAPPFTLLSRVGQEIGGSNIMLAGQDCFWEEEGAFTGEVSPRMLMDAGCSHVIIGHSERRQYFGETDDTVNRKIKTALTAGLTVLFCIGETVAEREAEQTFSVLRRQLTVGLSGINALQSSGVIIAYEPIWAIGTGKTATDSQAQEAHLFIRGVMAELYGRQAAEAIRIIYGGSVKPENIKGLMAQQDIDGALVGGASLNADSFAAIVNFGAN
jgi:triosephosphate isomerase